MLRIEKHRRVGLALAGIVALLATACRMEARPGSGVQDVKRVRIGGVLWYVDYDAAVEIAREQDKALWVHFGENPG